MMSTHKITAGHGYTYLTSVAAQDASALPPDGLGSYYAGHGEAGQHLDLLEPQARGVLAGLTPIGPRLFPLNWARKHC